MKKIIMVIVAWLLLAGVNSYANDVTIDNSGNVETGVSNKDANLEVTGASAEDAILGSASGTGAAGVYGIRSDNGNYGILGYENYGVYGFSSTGLAGYFDGDAEVTGVLTVGSLTGYTEIDPEYSAWDKSTGISITESQITDLSHFTTGDETDPTVISSVKDGVDWSELSGIPAGFADGIDDTGAGAAPAQRVIVAQSGGDYTTVSAALAAISPSASNPYVIDVMPGTYTENIVMKSYVHLRGTGSKVTVLTALSSPIIDMDGISTAEVSGLSIDGGSIVMNGIRLINGSSGARIHDIQMINHTGYAIEIISNSSAGIYNNKIIGNGGGVYIDESNTQIIANSFCDDYFVCNGIDITANVNCDEAMCYSYSVIISNVMKTIMGSKGTGWGNSYYGFGNTSEYGLVNLITNNEIMDDQINGDKIAPTSISTSHIEASAVTSSILADASVSSAKLQDFSVTNGKLDLSVTEYTEITAPTTTPVTQTTVVHNFCAISKVKLQTGDPGTNKYCDLSRNGNGTWTLVARGGSTQASVTCRVTCF